jgi:hypothetical protein
MPTARGGRSESACVCDGQAVDGILNLMVRRCLSIVVALVMAGTPVTMNLCQLTCAEMASSQASHSGHDHAAGGDADAAQRLHLAPMSPSVRSRGRAAGTDDRVRGEGPSTASTDAGGGRHHPEPAARAAWRPGVIRIEPAPAARDPSRAPAAGLIPRSRHLFAQSLCVVS